MSSHRLFLITLLALLALFTACDDSAEEEAAPPPPGGGLSVSLLEPELKSVLIEAPLAGGETRIFSTTIINDQIPQALKPPTTDQPEDGQVSEDAKPKNANGVPAVGKLSLAVPPKENPANPEYPVIKPVIGAYRVEAPLALERALPVGHVLTAVTPHQEHIVSGGWLQAMQASRYLLLPKGKKTAEGMTILHHRKKSAAAWKSAYSDGAMLFYEQPKEKEPGKWKLRSLAGEETPLDLGAIDTTKGVIEDAQGGYFLLEIPADSHSTYLLINGTNKSVTTICEKKCEVAKLVRHPISGFYVWSLDLVSEQQPFRLASTDMKQQWTLATTPTLAATEQLQSLKYHSARFLPTGELVYTRFLSIVGAGNSYVGSKITTTTTIASFNPADASARTLFEWTEPKPETLLQAPSVQRLVWDSDHIYAMAGDRVLAKTSDVLWSLTAKNLSGAEYTVAASYVTWIAADGTKTDVASSEAGIEAAAYWPATGRIALQINEAEPRLKIVKADSGAEETVIPKAVWIPVEAAPFWPFLIFDNRDGSAQDEHRLEIIGPYLDRVTLGSVEASAFTVHVAPRSTEAAPSRASDETTVPQLTLEVQPAEVNASPTTQQASVQVIGATPFEGVAGTITCDKATPTPAALPGGNDLALVVIATLAGAENATCTVKADDGFKTASAQFVVKYVKPDVPPPPPPPPPPPGPTPLIGKNFPFVEDDPNGAVYLVPKEANSNIAVIVVDPEKGPQLDNWPIVFVDAANKTPVAKCSTNTPGVKMYTNNNWNLTPEENMTKWPWRYQLRYQFALDQAPPVDAVETCTITIQGTSIAKTMKVKWRVK